MRHGAPHQEEAPSLPGWVSAVRATDRVLGVLNWLNDGESLDQNRVTNMLLFVCQEFVLIVDRCHGREALPTYGVRSSAQIRAMSELAKRRHVLTRFDGKYLMSLSPRCLFATRHN
jgi:hypothetical protein